MQHDALMHTDLTGQCLKSIAFATGSTLAFVAAVAAAIAVPVFGLAEAGALVLAHGLALAEIANAIYECM